MAHAPLTPEQRSMRSRIAAHRMHAQGKTSTAAGRAAFLERFEREVDPDGTLPPAERARRAEHARKAYFAGLALKSVRARARAKALAAEADAADAELADLGEEGAA